MLPKKHRLSKHAEVAKTTAKGRSFFSSSFIIKSLVSSGATTKFTVITSVKVSKSAVVRNRIKRIIRQVIQNNLDKIKSGQYAIIVKRAAVGVISQELAKEVQQALEKSKLIKS
jgi:ribonuclease P protein component